MIDITLKQIGMGLYSFCESKPYQGYTPLGEYLEDVLGKTDFVYTKLFMKDPEIISCSSNMSSITKNAHYIMIHSLYSTDEIVKIPKDKFFKLLEQLSEVAYLREEGYRPKEILFIFDDQWNCTITPIY